MHLLMLLITMLITTLLPVPTRAGDLNDSCAPFFQALLQVPHESLVRRDGLFTSQWSGHCVEGCLVVMQTDQVRLGSPALLDSQALADLSAEPGTPLYQDGWRSNPAYTADGAGTGVIGLERDGALCLVYTEQPSFIDDNGQFVQSEAIKVRVECPIAIQSDKPCPGDEECAGPCK
jgi:hypothetical protein